MSNVKNGNPKDLVGVKKASLSCVPAQVLAEIGVAMMEGRAKYGQYNYRIDGVRASVYYDATIRHLFSWWDAGEDIDSDSGMSHVTKAITSLVVLRDAMMNGMMTDDRPPSSKPFYGSLNERAAEIVEKYADKNPKHYKIGDNQSKKLSEDGWIEWNGGECPVSTTTRIFARYRNGTEPIFDYEAKEYTWEHILGDTDIIAYRIIKDSE